MWLSTHHIIFTQALASAAFSEGVCASVSRESWAATLSRQDAGSGESRRVTDVYLRAAWLAHLGEGIWVTRGPGLQKPACRSLRSKDSTWGREGQLQLQVNKSQGRGLEERFKQQTLGGVALTVSHSKDSLGACHLTIQPSPCHTFQIPKSRRKLQLNYGNSCPPPNVTILIIPRPDRKSIVERSRTTKWQCHYWITSTFRNQFLLSWAACGATVASCSVRRQNAQAPFRHTEQSIPDNWTPRLSEPLTHIFKTLFKDYLNI